MWGIPPEHLEAIFQHSDTPKYLQNFKNPCWFQGKNTSFKCIPYFYLLGVAKCGTTRIYYELIRHPDIVAPNKKDIFFWNSPKNGKSFGKYLNNFQNPTIYKNTDNNGYHPLITFEATPGYFARFDKIWQIPNNTVNGEYKYTLPYALYTMNPKTKLLVTLRNPTDRLFSHYHHMHRADFSPEDFHSHVVTGINMMTSCLDTRSLRSCAFDFKLNRKILQGDRILLHFSMYYVYAKEWLSVFPRDQMLFIKAEEFYRNQTAAMKPVYSFLELDNSPEILDVYDKTKTKSYEVDYRGTMWNSTRTILNDFFRPFNTKLAEFLGDEKWLFAD